MKNYLCNHIIYSVILLSFAFSQAPKWKQFVGFDRVQGLAVQNNNLWVATGSCIFQINLTSKEYKKYTAADGLGHHSFRTIAFDSNQTIWATNTWGIASLKVGSTRWVRGASFFYGKDIVFDKNGIGWIASSYGIYKMLVNGSVVKIKEKGSEFVCLDKQGNIYFDAYYSLLKISTNNSETTYSSANSNFPSDRITDLIVDSNNLIWIATQDSGLVSFDGINFTRYNKTNTTLASNKIQNLGLIQNKYLVIAVQSANCSTLLYKYIDGNFVLIENSPIVGVVTASSSDNKTGKMFISARTSFLQIPETPQLFSYDGIQFEQISLEKGIDIPYAASNSIALDSSGDIWISGYVGGVSRIKVNKISNWDYRTSNLPAANFFSAINIDKNGRVFVSSSDVSVTGNCGNGYFSGGISWLIDTSWVTISSKSEHKTGYSDILIDNNNNKYFFSAGKGFLLDGQELKYYGDFPRAVFGTNDTLWFARNDTIYNYKNNIYTPYKLPWGSEITSNLALAQDGSIWFTLDKFCDGVTNIVLAKYKNGSWSRYVGPNPTHYNYCNPTLRGYGMVTVENDNKVWIATNGSGLLCFDTGIWKQYHPDNSDIGISYINEVIVDKLGNKWLASANYEGTIVEFNETGIVTHLSDYPKKDLETNKSFTLSQNYPNPFNSTTIINYSITKEEFVELKICDILGREIKTLVSENRTPGNYSQKWKADNYPAGIYFCRLFVGAKSEIKKIILLR